MIQIVGHRGAQDVAPENTLSGFDKALSDGATAIELDVRRCKGQEDFLAVIHDSTIDRTTNSTGRVKRFTMQELKEFDAGGGAKIPSLQEVLDHLQGRVEQIFIEIKSPQLASDIAGTVLQEVMAGNWTYQQLVVICKYPFVVETVRELSSEIYIGAHIENSNNRDDVGGDKGKFSFSLDTMETDIIAAFKRLKPNYLLPRVDIISKEMVVLAHEHGVKVSTWTINEESDVRKAIDVGVDSVIANNPAFVKSLL